MDILIDEDLMNITKIQPYPVPIIHKPLSITTKKKTPPYKLQSLPFSLSQLTLSQKQTLPKSPPLPTSINTPTPQTSLIISQTHLFFLSLETSTNSPLFLSLSFSLLFFPFIYFPSHLHKPQKPQKNKSPYPNYL